jgi:hypothetical protein
MIHEFNLPVEVETDLGIGIVWYVKYNGVHMNDEYTVILKTGEVRHFTTTQIRITKNYTYNINTETNERKTNQETAMDGEGNL